MEPCLYSGIIMIYRVPYCLLYSENLEAYGHEIRKKESYIKFKNETNKCFAYTCTTLNFQMLWVMAPIVPVVLPC